ncbi:MAG TPA: O-antigen ligase family protein [Solirubrobacteraceae bacterium]|nr:O-antigen ligase family protein [Solirubrobacteraceae bacterium]
MAGRLLDSRLAFLAAAPIAIPLGYVSAMWPLYALAGVAVFILLLLAVTRVETLLLALAAVLPWEGALEYPTESVSVVKILGVVLFLAWLLRALVRSEPLRVSPALGWAAFFGLAVGLSMLFAPDPSDSLLDALRYALFIVFFFLVLQLTHTIEDVRKLIRVVVVSCTLAGAWGIYGFVALDLERAAGPITDANDFAYLMACALPLACYLLVEEKRRRLLWGFCFVVLVGATMATLSRGALVGLAALAPWAIITRRVPVTGVLLGLVALVSVAALAFALWAPLLNDRLERKNNIASKNVGAREALWEGAVRMSVDRPLTGVGPGRFGIESPAYVRNNPIDLHEPVVHNSYLHVLAEIGLLGLIGFVGFLASSWRLLSRGRRRAISIGDKDGQRLATAMQASLVVAIAAGAFLSEQFTTPFWMIGALATVVAGVPQAIRVVVPPRAALRGAAAPV